jgi:hypothetical protein
MLVLAQPKLRMYILLAISSMVDLHSYFDSCAWLHTFGHVASRMYIKDLHDLC